MLRHRYKLPRVSSSSGQHHHHHRHPRRLRDATGKKVGVDGCYKYGEDDGGGGGGGWCSDWNGERWLAYHVLCILLARMLLLPFLLLLLLWSVDSSYGGEGGLRRCSGRWYL